MSCGKKAPNFELALEKSSLTSIHKTILQERYIKVLSAYEQRCLRIAILFHLIRIFITVGSLVVPALLSIQYVDTGDTQVAANITNPASFAYRIYWATWVISLLVTTSNGVLSVFKIDKKYFFLHTTLEHLRSEGWQFLQLSGRYSGFYTPHTTPTHENQFVYFCHIVEKIKMKQVEEEYYKLSDAGNQHGTQAPKSTNGDTSTETAVTKKTETNSLIPPTPLNNLLHQASSLPAELLQQIASMATAGAQAPTNSVPSTAPIQRKTSDEVEGDSSNGATAPKMSVPT